MKFMLMKSGTMSASQTLLQLSPEELMAHIQFMLDMQESLTKSGELVLAEGLEFPPSPKIVTAKRPDAPIVSDGPFPESKEFLAGFWIVDVETPQRAIEIAAKASTAPGKGGAPMSLPIEVRQVMSGPPPTE